MHSDPTGPPTPARRLWEEAAQTGRPAFDPPEMAPQTPSLTHQIERTHPRRVVHDLLSGNLTVDFPRWTHATEMTDIATTVTSQGHVRHEITDGDPLSALTTTEYRVTIARPDATVGHWSRGRMSCDATHFILETELSVTENGTEIFRREWHERVRRDLV